MSKQQITKEEFDSLVETFKETWEEADEAGKEGHRTEAGLRAVLDTLGVGVKVHREWKDGDIVAVFNRSVYYVRRGGQWYEISTGFGRRYSDGAVEKYLDNGTFVEWTP